MALTELASMALIVAIARKRRPAQPKRLQRMTSQYAAIFALFIPAQDYNGVQRMVSGASGRHVDNKPPVYSSLELTCP
jgi:hypothetical protein